MESQSDRAIVLRSIPFQERHRVVTALTEHHGQVSALAKNSIQSRRFGGTLDIFAASLWTFTIKPGSQLYHLSEAHIREPFAELRQDFMKLSYASVMNELMIRMAPQDEACLDLFRLHSNALTALSEIKEEMREDEKGRKDTENNYKIVILNAYMAKLLQWSGSQPRLHYCLECETALESFESTPELTSSSYSTYSTPVELTCMIAQAGWVCPDCRKNKTRHIRETEGQTLEQLPLRLTPAGVRDFQLSLCIPIRQMALHAQASLQEHWELFRYLEALYFYHIPGFDQNPLKSLRFIKTEKYNN